jgi:hypothetical protein
VRIALLLLSLLIAAPAVAEPLWTPRPKPKGLSFGGNYSMTFAPDLRMEGPYEDRFAWRNDLSFRVKHKFADDARYAIGARLRWQVRSGDSVEADYWLDLEPTWFQFRKDFFTMRAGLQTMKWGKNLLLSPNDIVNPLDYTRGLSTGDPADAKIPTLMVRATFDMSPATVDILFAPFFQPMRVAWYGQDFSVLRPGMLEGILPTLRPDTSSGLIDDELRRATDRVVDAVTGLDAYARDGLQSYLVTALPEELPWNGDLGARLALSGRGVDGDVYFLWHVVDQPAITIHRALREPLLDNRVPTSAELTQLTNPDTEIIGTEYHRSVLAGGDIVIAAGSFVISAEGAFRSHTVRYRETMEPFLSPAVQYSVAVRYTHGSVLALDVEFGHDIVLRPAEDMLVHRPHNLQVALGASLNLLRDRLQILLTGSYNILRQDIYVHPRITVELDDRVSVLLGVQVFKGLQPDVEPTLDSFLSYEGGIPGYFRENDYAYGTVKLDF